MTELDPQTQKMEALGRLAVGVAHDFNNILTVIQSYAGMLEEALDVTDERRRDASEIKRATARAVKLTRQLLVLSRQSASQPRPTLIDELVAGFKSTLAQLLGPGIELEIQRCEVPHVLVDPNQLEQVVMNLAVNARDAMHGKGRLTIESSTVTLAPDLADLHGLPPGRYVVLAVTDTGAGMSPEIQKRIFEPFFTTKPNDRGTGLGLSIAHGIVAQAGGALDVYSEVGRGTTFRIRLPVTAETSAVAMEAPVAPPRPLEPITVLFVDREADLRALGGRILRDAGCTVLEAGTGNAARDLCVTHDGPIHVAAIDATLADGRGEQLARVLRELRPELQVILMSGFPVGALGPTGERSIEVLAKPFTPVQLREAIAAASNESEPSRHSEPTLQSSVLIVDDDPALRRMLARLLKRAAFDVIDVTSVQDALVALQSRRVDVVLSDIHMPGGDGLDLLRSVRRIDLDIPVILMSGKPDVSTAATALEYGAFRYLTKPLESDAVERIVRQGARAHALARIRREAMTGGGAPSDRAGLEVRFEQALAGMWMAFQPIYETHTNAVFGVEALLRSEEPSLPHPGAVLDAAAQLGRMPMLGRRTRLLSALALGTRTNIPALFVNLHPLDLLDVSLIDPDAPLTQIASRVVLEVTERESLASTPELATRLERLRELGFRIAIDDIGAGYSGLTSFTDLTPEIVKIDMSLVRSIDTSTVKQRTVSALCTLCHEMGALVVGEGVETAGERACLTALGCDLLQGYLLARPSRELP